MAPCKNCHRDYEPTAKHGFPASTLCGDCRIQRRLAFRNDWNLYSHSCDLCHKTMASIYSPDKNLKVYCQACYWSDQWDATNYGQDFDFSRPFFEQFEEILHKTPLQNTTITNCTNSDYCTNIAHSKDSYLSTRIGHGDEILYTYLALQSTQCTDCYGVTSCQYCHACIDSWSLYNCAFCQLCKNTSDSILCHDCIGCKNCFGSVGLRNKEYCFFNEQLTKEDYENRVKSINLEEAKQRFREHALKFPHKAINILNSENAHGDCISNSKNIHNSYDIEQSEDIANSWGVDFSKDLDEASYTYYGEHGYEVIGFVESNNVQFSAFPYNCSDSTYLFQCYNDTKNCFGSVSLRRKQNCILNKQYSQADYETLRAKIIEHMKSTGEYGEFFPMKISPFAYNETVAQEFFTLTQAEIEAKGLKWKDVERKPNNLQDENILSCVECERMFRLIPKELEIYREKNLPKPTKCHICRHKDRLKMRNPKKLWNRNCNQCQTPIETTYAPDRPEIVYCEACYLAALY